MILITDINKITHCHLCNQQLKIVTRFGSNLIFECINCFCNCLISKRPLSLCFINKSSGGFDLGLEIDNKHYIITYNKTYQSISLFDIHNNISTKINFDFQLEPNIKENLERLVSKVLKLRIFD